MEKRHEKATNTARHHLPTLVNTCWLHPIFVVPLPPSVLQRKTSTAPQRIWSLYAFLSEQSLAMVGLEAPQKGMIASWGLQSCLPTDLQNRKSPITTGQSCFPAIWRGTLGKGLAFSKTCLRKQGIQRQRHEQKLSRNLVHQSQASAS